MKKILASFVLALALLSGLQVAVAPSGFGIHAQQAEAAAPVPSCVLTYGASRAAPLAVFLDTTGTTDSDTTKPFHDLEVLTLWRDSEGFFATSNGVPGNLPSGVSKSYSWGPLAAHVYETPGTYNITTYFKDSASGQAVSCSNTLTVVAADTVWPASKTECIVSSGSDFSLCPFTTGQGATHTTQASFSTALANCVTATDKRCLFNGTFTMAANGVITETGAIYIGKFPGAAKPTINAGAAVDVIQITSSDVNDLRVTDLNIVGVGAAAFNTGGNLLQVDGDSIHVTNLLLLRVDAVDMSSGISTTGPCCGADSETRISGVYQENRIYNYRQGLMVFGGHINTGVLGNWAGPSLSSGEHTMRFQPAQKVAVYGNTFEPPMGDTGKSHLTIRAGAHRTLSSPDAFNDTRYAYVSLNKFNNYNVSWTDSSSGSHTGTGNWIVQFAPAGSTQCNWGSDIVFEKNFITFSSAGESGLWNDVGVLSEWIDVTIRNNLFDAPNRTGAGLVAVTVQNSQETSNLCDDAAGQSGNAGDTMPPPNRTVIENNTFRVAGTVDAANLVVLEGRLHSGVLNSRVFNNLGYAPGATTTRIPWLLGTTTGSTSGNNSTDSSGADQIKNVNPFIGTPTEALASFRLDPASYAVNGGAALFPSSYKDLLGCYAKTGANRIGAFVELVQASCYPQSFVFAPFK